MKYCHIASLPRNHLFSFVNSNAVCLYRGRSLKEQDYAVNLNWQTLERIPLGISPNVYPISNVDFFYKDICVARLFDHRFSLTSGIFYKKNRYNSTNVSSGQTHQSPSNKLIIYVPLAAEFYFRGRHIWTVD